MNGYSKKDWVLRAMSAVTGEAAGVVPVRNCGGIENINLTALVDGHFGYMQRGSDILDVLGLYT